MRSTYSTLMQSRFFNPAFNSAIFDGPVRIYFTQAQESLALKIYFYLQQKFPEALNHAKSVHPDVGRNILVMIYPSSDSFQLSFEGHSDFMVQDELADDVLLGINGPFEDDQLPQIAERISEIFLTWEADHAPALQL